MLFQNIMDISKCLQSAEIERNGGHFSPKPFKPEAAAKIACQGTRLCGRPPFALQTAQECRCLYCQFGFSVHSDPCETVQSRSRRIPPLRIPLWRNPGLSRVSLFFSIVTAFPLYYLLFTSPLHYGKIVDLFILRDFAADLHSLCKQLKRKRDLLSCRPVRQLTSFAQLSS